MDQIPVTQKIVYQYDSSGFYVATRSPSWTQ